MMTYCWLARCCAIAILCLAPPFACGGEPHSPIPVLVLDSGSRIVAQVSANDVALFDTKTASITRQYFGTGRISTTTMAFGGDRIAMVGVNGDVSIWNTASGELVRRISHEESGLRFGGATSFSGDGKTILVGDMHDRAMLLHVESGKVKGSIGFPTGKTSVAFAAAGEDGSSGFLLPIRGNLRKFSLSLNTIKLEDTDKVATGPLCYSRCCRYLAYCTERKAGGRQIAVMSIDSSRIFIVPDVFRQISSIRSQNDGQFAFTAEASVMRGDDTVHVGGVISPTAEQHEVLWRLSERELDARRLEFCPESLIGYVTDDDYQTHAYDLRTGESIAVFVPHRIVASALQSVILVASSAILGIVLLYYSGSVAQRLVRLARIGR